MAGTYFVDFSLTTGANDGSSWEDALQSVSALISVANSDPGSTFRIKEGTVHQVQRLDFSGAATLLCGFSAALTGTNYNDNTRTSYTTFDGTNSSVGFIDISASTLVDRAIVTNFNLSQSVLIGQANETFTLRNCEICECSVTGSNSIISAEYTYLNVVSTRIHDCENNGYEDIVRGRAFDISLINTAIYDCVVGWPDKGVVSCYETTDNVVIINCTFANNTGNGTLFQHLGAAYLANNIFWGNLGTTITMDNGYCIYCCTDETVVGAIDTTGTVSDNPQFLGAGSHPYELSSSTPSSVADGASTGVTGYVATDVLGESRGSTPSMGAYEYITTGGGQTDTLLGGTYSHTGATLSTTRGRSDTLLGGTYAYSGETLSVSAGKSDALLGGAYSHTGATLSTTRGRSDTLLGGTYSHTGATLSTTRGRSDTLLGGTYSHTGATLSTTRGRSDTLLGGVYSHTGATLDVTAGRSDTLLGGTYTYSGLTLSVTGVSKDTLLGGVYSYSGFILNVSRGLSDNLLGGTYTYSGLTLNTSTGRSDNLLGGTYTHSGSTLQTTRAYADNLLGGVYAYSGATINAHRVREDALLGAVFAYTGLTLPTTRVRTDTLLGGVYTYSGATVDFAPGDGSAVTLFLDKFPVFASVPTSVIQAAMVEAALEMSESDWGVWYDIGLWYLTAWILSSEYSEELGIGGPAVKSRTYGESAISFAAPDSAFFASSHSDNWFGYRYDEIVEFHIGLHFVLAPGNPGRTVPGADDDTAVSVATFKSKFPIYALVDSDTVQAALDEAILELYEANWGALYQTGVLYFAAYLLAECAGVNAGLGGSISMRKEGRVSVSFAGIDASFIGPHSFNKYGKRYDTLIDNHIGKGAFVV